MNDDDINKIETLIGYVQAAGKGNYPFGDERLVKVAAEAEEWMAEVKAHRGARG